MSPPESVRSTCRADPAQTSPATPVGRPGSVPVTAGSDPQSLEFPGCRAKRLTAEQLDALEEDPKNRFEYWDRDTEMVWMVREPTGAAHELPGHRLAQCRHAVGAVRGWEIECLGAMNERPWTERTHEALDRVGRRLGAAQGTGPDDLPWLRKHRAEGRTEGEARERTRIRDLLMDRIPGPDYPRDAPGARRSVGRRDHRALIQCVDESEFHARISESMDEDSCAK